MDSFRKWKTFGKSGGANSTKNANVCEHVGVCRSLAEMQVDIIFLTFVYIFKNKLFVFLSEQREVYVAFGVLSQIDQQRVGTAHGRGEIVVE